MKISNITERRDKGESEITNFFTELSLESPMWGHLGFWLTVLGVATAPFSGFNSIAFLSVSDILFVLAFCVAAVELAREGNFSIPRPAIIAVILGCCLLALEILRIQSAVRPDLAMGWARTRAGNILIFLVLILTLQTKRDLRIILRTLVLSLLVVSLATILQSVGVVGFGDALIRSRSIFGFQIPFRRTLGVPMDYGNFGMYMSIGLAGLLYERQKFQSQWILLALPIYLLAIFISQSRSTWAAIIAVVVILSGYRAYRYLDCRNFDNLQYIFAASCALIFPPLGFLFVRLLIFINPLTLYSRLHAYQNALGYFVHQPLFGIGRYSYYSITGDEIIHNGFLNLLVAFGIIGFSLFICIYALSLLSTVRLAIHSNDPTIWVAILAALAGMTVELMLFDGTYTKVLWITFALALVNPMVGQGIELAIREKDEAL